MGGYPTAHIEVQTINPKYSALPITETAPTTYAVLTTSFEAAASRWFLLDPSIYDNILYQI
jgi:hypothetical protein